MYYAHFGLTQPPFKITPNTEFFFSGGNRGAILDALMYAVTSGEGIVKVVGEVGSGKTMLCRMLQTLLPEQVESIYLANPSVAPEDVLHAIAFELQLNLSKDADRLQVMQVLQKYLLDRHAEGKQVVIFVEEAQGMPLATLEEIRLLSNLETKYDKLLQIVLFGQPELDVNLNSNQIRQLRERITHSFNLGPLDEKAIGEYIIFRLRAAGYFGPHLFDKKAIALIAKAAEGLVRRVNILADKSLLAAFSENVYLVTSKHVQAAIKDSEFGGEHVKRKFRSHTLTAIAATLVLGLSAGYLLNQWLPKLTGSSAKPAESAKALATPPAAIVKETAKDPLITEPTAAVDTAPKGEPAPQPAAVPAIPLNTTPQNTPPQTAAAQAPATPAPAKPGQAPVQTSVQTPPQPVEPRQSSPSPNAVPVTSPSPAAAMEGMPPQKPAVATPAAVPASAAMPVSASQASADGARTSPDAGSLLQTRLDATQAWLQQQPESTVSIQLLGSADDQQLSNHLATLGRQLDIQSIYPFRTQVAGQPFITVLYGSYATRQEAMQAVRQLPKSIKSYNPHLRTIGGILKETNKFQ